MVAFRLIEGLETKPYAVSGHVVFVCKLAAGYKWNIKERRNGWRYITKGNIHIVYPDGTETNFVPQTLMRDTLAEPKSTALKEVEATVLEDLEWVCYSDIENNTVVYPEFSHRPIGQKFNLNVGSDMFLISGTLDVNGKEFVGPVTIRIRKQDVVCNPITECYTFEFK